MMTGWQLSLADCPDSPSRVSVNHQCVLIPVACSIFRKKPSEHRHGWRLEPFTRPCQRPLRASSKSASKTSPSKRRIHGDFQLEVSQEEWYCSAASDKYSSMNFKLQHRL
uniref:Uncharacterized protein n=1 Tax=Zea mays TaxID=4577 RepID=C0PIJ4_MAIZE|nr:unknown [Zea mays]